MKLIVKDPNRRAPANEAEYSGFSEHISTVGRQGVEMLERFQEEEMSLLLEA